MSQASLTFTLTKSNGLSIVDEKKRKISTRPLADLDLAARVT